MVEELALEPYDDALPPESGKIRRLLSQDLQAETMDTARAWGELLDGLWSVVERFDRERRRFWIARKNPAPVAEQHCLNGVERRVVMQLVNGASQKRIAVELGLAESSVSKHAAAARNKLGLRTSAELIELYATLNAAHD